MTDLLSVWLKTPSLLETRAYVNGQWIESDRKFDVTDPATGRLVAQVSDFDVATTANAIDAAQAAGPAWAALTGKERSTILRRWHDLLIENARRPCHHSHR